MRTRGGEGQFRIGFGRVVRSIEPALEEQNAIRQNPGRGHPFAKTLRDGAEIFADDDAARAEAGQRDDSAQVIDRVGHVGSRARAGAARDPV